MGHEARGCALWPVSRAPEKLIAYLWAQAFGPTEAM